MTFQASHPVEDRLQALLIRWQEYRRQGGFEQFVEYSVALNSLSEHLGRLRLPGLLRIAQGLENAVLARFGDEGQHPLPEGDINALQRQLDALTGAVASSRQPLGERRAEAGVAVEPEWVRPRAIWLIGRPDALCADGLDRQLSHFGFKPRFVEWQGDLPADELPLAVLFSADDAVPRGEQLARIAAVRIAVPAGQLFFLGSERSMAPVVALMRAGIDVTVPRDEVAASVLARILDLVQNREQERYRVLAVEDSKVAAAVIRRTLGEHGMDCEVVTDPGTLLDVLPQFRPDLILMDMYMPGFTGVEATRVLRQVAGYQALPIIYLSSESDIGMQIEALRLGGDQFLMKPINPVLLAAVVRTKIERYRETVRSTRTDGLTGLLNHTASKSMLRSLCALAAERGNLCVAMIDIDHFKSVNDTWGHPVGDQVIRSLAWLLKGRLRTGDLIGRYGGEEFILALPDASPEQAMAVIERIRRDFSALPHAHAEGVLHATFSAGLACVNCFPVADDLTAAADGALLEAKRRGRNQVRCACNEAGER